MIQVPELQVFMHADEKEFLLHFLKPDMFVLEWGSGGSTIEIAKKVDFLFSVEHNDVWLDKVNANIKYNHINNAIVRLEKPLTPYSWEQNQDGNLTQFLSYVALPYNVYKQKTFDLILIDGRARPYCAEIVPLIAKDNAQIFVHDFQPDTYPGRKDYNRIKEVLKFEGQVHDLAKFSLKVLK